MTIQYFRIFLVSLILVNLCSCESNKTKIKNGEQLVKKFVTNLQLDNSEMLQKIYPNFKKIKQTILHKRTRFSE